MNYKINGEVMSFKSKEDLLKILHVIVDGKKEILEVEPLDRDCEDYDHMQEIMDLTYQALAFVKGITAVAAQIQGEGHFLNYNTTEITFLGIRCKELMDEIMEICDAAEEVYPEDWKKRKEMLAHERQEAQKY